MRQIPRVKTWVPRGGFLGCYEDVDSGLRMMRNGENETLVFIRGCLRDTVYRAYNVCMWKRLGTETYVIMKGISDGEIARALSHWSISGLACRHGAVSEQCRGKVILQLKVLIIHKVRRICIALSP